MGWKQLTEEVVELSRKVGSFIRKEASLLRSDQVESKSFNNLVSYVDNELLPSPFKLEVVLARQ